MLERAFLEQTGPQEMVAKELAKIYLDVVPAGSGCQGDRALASARAAGSRALSLEQRDRVAVECRNRGLDPELSGRARSRSESRQSTTGAGAGIEQRPPIRRSRAEFGVYLKRKPKDTAAFLGLGRNAFQQGKIEDADGSGKPRLQTNPRDPETLKELGQLDLRLGRFEKACKRLKLLSEIEPYDHEVRYSYAQALKIAGDADQAKKELDRRPACGKSTTRSFSSGTRC